MRNTIVTIAKTKLKKEFEQTFDVEESFSDKSLRYILDRASELRVDDESVKCIQFALDF